MIAHTPDRVVEYKSMVPIAPAITDFLILINDQARDTQLRKASASGKTSLTCP